MAERDTTGTGGSGTPDNKTDLKQTLGRTAGEAVNQTVDQAMEAGRQTVGSAQGRIRSLLEQQTDRAADQLGGVASALHKAAEQLDAENNGTAAQYAVQAAGRVEQVADLLRHSSLDDIVSEVEGFARRQPEVFIGAAFAVGFLAARFIKSSGERRLQGQKGRGESPSRGMAGGIAEAALSTPRRGVDTTMGGTAPGTAPDPSAAHDLHRSPAGTPRAAGTGMPLSRAPAPVGSHGAPPAGTTLGSGALSGTGSTAKPQGQRP